MKIDRNKPLPDHTKLDYDECCAFLILKELFPDRYIGLKVMDKPDLQTDDTGIEVTWAADRKHQEALKNWIIACSSEDENIIRRSTDRMEQLGVKYTGGVQGWQNYNPSFELIEEAVKQKIKKKQSGYYKFFHTYELFIFTDVWMHYDMVKRVKDFFVITNVYKDYSKIYILSQGCELHIFKEDDYDSIIIDSGIQSDRNMRARRMVEEAEEAE